ncbi:MAG: transglycosylase SLT domain-containing protein [Treponemataceae bacterium]|nr:transglycosylase SLT domain-containing protein [Treponemataceae bacterium]
MMRKFFFFCIPFGLSSLVVIPPLYLHVQSVFTASALEKLSPEWVALHPSEYRAAVLTFKDNPKNTILTLYRHTLSRESVISFFEALTHSRFLAESILAYCDQFEVPPSLAFALVWEESRFNPRAVNTNKGSVDRGLFQLNSKAFPNLKEQDFFNPDLNARYGIAHLRWCLDLGGSEVAGLAMYNAGTTRVRADSTPKKTLDYIARVQAFRDGVEDLFNREIASHWVTADGTVKAASSENRLALFPSLKGELR